MPRPMLIAGNWKMNGNIASIAEVESIAAAADAAPPHVTVALAPPFTLIDRAKAAAEGTRLLLAGQDCHANPSGAHTGDVSAPMLRDIGCSHVIVGHSERRADHGETDACVRAKAAAAVAVGLVAIVCVGETEAERDEGKAEAVVTRQLAGSIPDTDATRIVIAYEPVWAIGTGRTPSHADVAAMHGHIRAWLSERFGDDGSRVRILYGGSVKPSNAAELLGADNVDGALVGGASLKASDFLPIIAAG